MSYIDQLVSANVHESRVSAIKDMAMRCARIPDAVSLSWGLPSFRTPEYIRELVKHHLDTDYDIGKYTLPDGLAELRVLAAHAYERSTGVMVDPDRHVMISAGNMQALNTLFHTMLDPGDEVILTDPCFASHIQQINLFSGVPVYWSLDEGRGWALDLESLPGLINEKTQAIVLVNPSNPTGRLFSKEELLYVGELAKQNNLLLVIDDPYSDFIYEDPHSFYHPGSDPGLRDNLVYMYSFSKSYAMSGWRLSYMIMPEELKHEAMKVHDATLICAPRISQLAGIAALSVDTGHKHLFRESLDKRRHLIMQRLEAIPELFSAQLPQGAYYVFPRINIAHQSSEQFAIELLNTCKVAVTPGHAFGPSGEHHVRMAYCVDEADINLAFDRIEKALKSGGVFK